MTSRLLLCHRQEVPRMLYEAEQVKQVAAYIQEVRDPELLRWWGKYNESLGQFDTALQSYQQANDTVAIVRLHCHQEDFVAACDVVESSDNAAAAFMLARQLEATDQVSLVLTTLPTCTSLSVWHQPTVCHNLQLAPPQKAATTTAVLRECGYGHGRNHTGIDWVAVNHLHAITWAECVEAYDFSLEWTDPVAIVP